MNDAPLSEPMSGKELLALRKRTGLRRTQFCGQLGIASARLYEFEGGTRDIPPEVAARARILDGQGAKSLKVCIASFGDKFVVVRFSLIEEVDRWRVDVLPIVHDNRASAVLAAKDYASRHGYEFSAVGF
ncbi:MAG: hypothetical protein JWL96_4577 [Sphingomonas bacterium]|uniref:helix-turn-helix domain-containing protein n=1 Tax=Sphingomonas bacterium TaxID=1895847 RepID=UPI00262CB667|nr:helix-turn-helix transcriptional regulator [Sphingomonas bacterium]MDB5712507.1 hypothetical protein [Sphingomonas bacterium]